MRNTACTVFDHGAFIASRVVSRLLRDSAGRKSSVKVFVPPCVEDHCPRAKLFKKHVRLRSDTRLAVGNYQSLNMCLLLLPILRRRVGQEAVGASPTYAKASVYTVGNAFAASVRDTFGVVRRLLP